MKNIIKSISVIVGAVVGAGFASGQEIYSFFNVYNENGLLGIIIASTLLGFIIYKVLKKSNDFNINTYNELLEKTGIPKKIRNILNIIINIFLLISFYIMVAGFIAYFKQEFGMPSIIIALIITSICYITFMKDIEGITKVSIKIVPILIIIIIIMGIRSNTFDTIKNINLGNISIKLNWLLKAIEYTSYNSILLIPVLISLKKYTKNNEKAISIVTAIIFGILSAIIYLIMLNNGNLFGIEIPLIQIADGYGSLFKYSYSLVIIFAIYTTMISEGYGFLTNCAKTSKQYKKLAIVLCVSAVFISNISFSFLINLTYPAFGILGVVQLIYLIFT